MNVRISGGFLKGRRIGGGPSVSFRPTTDRNRQMVFNILGADLIRANFMDLYCGSGIVGIEALSRGAAHVTFVDNNTQAIEQLQHAVETLCQKTVCSIIADDAKVLSKLQSHPLEHSIIFLDPPYDHFPIPNMQRICALLSPGGILIYEHAAHRKPETEPGLSVILERTAGESGFTFFRKDAQ